jgi:hypothetical protein
MPHQCTNCGHTFADGSKEMLSGCPGCGGNTFQFHPKGTDVPEEPPDDAGTRPPEPEGGSAANTVGRAATRVRDFVGTGSERDAATDSGPSDRESGTPGDPGTVHDSTAAPPDPAAPWPDELDDVVGGEAEDAEIIDADARREDDPSGDAEDFAQTSARADVAAPDDVAAGAADPPASGGTDPSVAPEGGVAASDGTPETAGPEPADGRVVSEPSGENPDIEELREQLNDQFESIKIVEPGQYELNLMELFDREEYIIALQENGRYVIQVPENWLGDRPGD